MSHDPKYLNTINRNTKSIIQIRIRLQIVKIYDIINNYDVIKAYDNINNTTYFHKRIASSRFAIRQPTVCLRAAEIYTYRYQNRRRLNI